MLPCGPAPSAQRTRTSVGELFRSDADQPRECRPASQKRLPAQLPQRQAAFCISTSRLDLILLASVTKRLVEIDDEKLALARELAGTPTIKASRRSGARRAHRAAPPARAPRRPARCPRCSISARTPTSSGPRDGGDRAGRRRHQRAHPSAASRGRHRGLAGDRQRVDPHVRDRPTRGDPRLPEATRAGRSRSTTSAGFPSFRSLPRPGHVPRQCRAPSSRAATTRR